MKHPVATILALVLVGASASLVRAGEPAAPAELPPPPVWKSAPPEGYDTLELTKVINPALNRGDRDYARGEKIFTDVGCKMCHLFGGGAGGIGPDITGVGGRFGTFEILQSILEPNERISDLYGMKDIGLKDGKSDRGKIVAEDEESISIVRTYSVDPNTLTAYWGSESVKLKLSDIAWMEESEVSAMPAGLINGLKEDEVADLLAYLISAGDPTNKMFRNFKKPATPPAAGTAPAAAPAATPAPAAPTTPPAKG